MDSLDVARVCVRRWYVFIPVVVLAAVAGYRVTGHGAPSYGATGSFALIYPHAVPPKSTDPDPRAANPLVAQGTAILKEAIVSDLSSPEAQRELGVAGASGAAAPGVTQGANARVGTSYTVDAPRLTQSIVISSTGASAEAVRQTVDHVLRSTPTRLATLQGEVGAPARSQYTSFVTSQPFVTQYPPPSRKKALIAFTVVGVLAGAALALLLDRVITRRRRRAGAPTVPGGELDDDLDSELAMTRQADPRTSVR